MIVYRAMLAILWALAAVGYWIADMIEPGWWRFPMALLFLVFASFSAHSVKKLALEDRERKRL